MVLIESFSGIRGIFGKDLFEDNAIRYAYSYFSFVRQKTKKKKPTIVIGRDTRQSGQRLMDAIMGIIDCDFINVGIAPTPCVEFAVRFFEADGGIIITASHNEPFWNGFKFLDNDGGVLAYNDMLQVINGKNYLKSFHKIQERKVLEKGKEAIEQYSRFLINTVGKGAISKIKGFSQKILIDPNGGAGIIAKYPLEKIGVNFEAVNMDFGDFQRKVEPTQDSLFYLTNQLRESGFDFAAGFDCDADRVELMLPNARLVSGNEVLALIVDYTLSKDENKRHTIVVNDATSGIIHEITRKYKAKVIEVEVGEANVIAEMKRRKAQVGGEGSSGGVIIPPSRCRDGIMTLMIILAICAQKEKKLQEIVWDLPEFYNLKMKIEYDSKLHDAIKTTLKSHYSRKKFKMIENGGKKGSLKVYTGEKSFIWFRASKTESDVFRIIADSPNESEARKLLGEAIKIFNEASAKANRKG